MAVSEKLRLTNGVVCCAGGLKRGTDLVVSEGRLTLTTAGRGSGDETVVDLGGRFVLPGFIEIHTHGAGLFEFTMGRYDRERGDFALSDAVYEEELPKYIKLRTSTGVTGIYPGTWAAPVERQQFCFRQLRKYMESPKNGREGARVFGGLLEGTFINRAKAGAQNPEHVFPPDIDLFKRINEDGVIKIVNVVPDHGSPAYELIDYLTGEGISVGAGHSGGTGDQYKEAIRRGLKYSIHFLNGGIGHSYKDFDGGGALEAVLREDLYAEIIADGVHVSPAYVRDILTRKGVERIMAVSDAMFSSQAGGIRDFTISGVHGRVDDSEKYVYVVGREQLTLFSSVLTMDAAFGNLMSWLTREMEGVWYRRHEAMGFDEAVSAAAKICSTNIAEMLRRRGCDDLESGEIADGKWADLVVADIDGDAGNYALRVKEVYVRGEIVLSAKC